jgi:hypothetical protein
MGVDPSVGSWGGAVRGGRYSGGDIEKKFTRNEGSLLINCHETIEAKGRELGNEK